MLPKRIRKQNLKAEQGFSLIELMIAMTLGLLLLTGVVQIFLSSKQAYSTVSGASQTLDNGRLSLHFLGNSIGKAGYWGDVTQPRFYREDTALSFNHSGPSNTPYSDSYAGVFTERSYIFGMDNDSTDANVINGTDQLWIRFNGHDLLPQFNCAGAAVNANQVAVERYYISEPTGSEQLSSLVCETTIMDFDNITGIVSAPTNPVISTQTLISGIENMQILFGQSNINNTQLQHLRASDVGNWEFIDSVRIAVLASSEEEVNSLVRSNGFTLLDIATNTPTDRRARRVFERTLALRNAN